MARGPSRRAHRGLLLPGVCPGDREKITSGEGDCWG